MTTLDLEPIKARLEAAAPGKWEYIENTGMYGNVLVSELDDGSGMWIDTGLELETGDAELIAHAPEDIAALIREVEELREAARAGDSGRASTCHHGTITT